MRHRSPNLTPGRWQLERERFHLDAFTPQPIPERASKISDLIPAFMKEQGLDEKLWQQALLNEWPQLVGEQVARRARPGKIQNRLLTIFVTNSVWLSELNRNGKPQMLKNLQARFGPDLIRDIRLQPDPDTEKPGR